VVVNAIPAGVPDADVDIERRLAREAAAGSETAFAALFEAYRLEVYRIACAVIGDPDLANDAVQETFLKVYEGLRHWREASAFRTWLFRIAVRSAIDQRRRSARHRRLPGLGREPTHDPRGQLDDALALERLQGLTERLASQQRLVLRLRLFGDLTNAEVAQALGLTASNVRMHLTQAVRRLRELL
jgi:RNA polymerase sigma-70 factor (ECF subfamily)